MQAYTTFIERVPVCRLYQIHSFKQLFSTSVITRAHDIWSIIRIKHLFCMHLLRARRVFSYYIFVTVHFFCNDWIDWLALSIVFIIIIFLLFSVPLSCRSSSLNGRAIGGFVHFKKTTFCNQCFFVFHNGDQMCWFRRICFDVQCRMQRYLANILRFKFDVDDGSISSFCSGCLR